MVILLLSMPFAFTATVIAAEILSFSPATSTVSTTVAFWACDSAQVRFFAEPYGLNIITFYNGFQIAQIMAAEKSNRGTFSTHPCGPAGAVCICLGSIRKIIINHMRYMTEIKTPACDIGSDYHLDLHLLEPIKNRCSL